jgi:hypothetical protein
MISMHFDKCYRPKIVDAFSFDFPHSIKVDKCCFIVNCLLIVQRGKFLILEKWVKTLIHSRIVGVIIKMVFIFESITFLLF